MKKFLTDFPTFDNITWNSLPPKIVIDPVFTSPNSTTKFFSDQFGKNSVNIINFNSEIEPLLNSEIRLLKTTEKNAYIRKTIMSINNIKLIYSRICIVENLLDKTFYKQIYDLGNKPIGNIIFTKSTIRSKFSFAENKDFLFRRSIINNPLGNILINEGFYKPSLYTIHQELLKFHQK
ncbi:MAG: chorismate lyase [Sphingobacteriia bacterium]|nr:chorismate lyase [Sphingobacteriia bacterium]